MKSLKMRLIFTFLLSFAVQFLFAQSAVIQGQLQEPSGAAVEFANIALYNASDTTLVKVETSDETGIFKIRSIKAGTYFLTASIVGFSDLTKTDIQLTADQQLDLGVLTFASSSVEMEEVTVTASRALVEVKPDRTVFNVEGTINSTGENAISLLQKAPSVTVDNNDNISVLGRAGVLIYVDGKRLPLSGQDLSAYLQNLPAEQIDRIDIITNPGAKYEAEGNAGIIDIRLKRDKNLGGNGSISGSFGKGRHQSYNLNASGNYRNKLMNVFGSAGVGRWEGFTEMSFLNFQNGLQLDEFNDIFFGNNYNNVRVGTDFFLGKKHTIGFLAGIRGANSENRTDNSIDIASIATPNQIDSLLIARNRAEGTRDQATFNLNYRFEDGQKRSVNIDLDAGSYNSDSDRLQPNRYYTANGETLLTERINVLDTPTEIDIYTAKIDFEQEFAGGKLGLGSKLSSVRSDNTFLFYDQINGVDTLNNFSSNQFDYDENVYAGYISYARSINQKWNVSAGLRAEQTDAMGNLQAFSDDLQEPPVELNYLSWFPSFGLTYTPKPNHSFAFNYGRRINRPDYNVLNPFNNQLSELSYEKGNPFLRPEIVNNVELGYTLAYRFNFKLGYSKTLDQITRLIAPDDLDPRAGFITWDNLAEQQIISFNASLPFQIRPKWNAYFNVSAAHQDNQADYGDGAIVDVQVFTYSIYTQNTFDLPNKFKAEVSGYFSGPGVWGGVFLYESLWSLNVGLQRKFFQDRLNVRLNATDLFYQSFWEGYSEFNGLRSEGKGLSDSRRVNLSVSYNFGNQNVKSRKRKTGLEEEGKRVGE